MSESKQLVTDLDKKVDQLLSNLKEAKASNETKDQEISSLKDSIAEQNNLVKELQEKSKAVESTEEFQTDTSEGNSEEVKVKINELVKEIDNCISLLKV